MRICFVSQEYPPETGNGGIATQTELKARGLAALGHDVVVVARSVDGERGERRDGRLQVVRIPGPEARFSDVSELGDWLGWSVDAAAEVARQHASAAIDIVEVPDWASEGYFHLVARQPWDNITTVVQLHGSVSQLSAGLGWPEPGSELERIGTQMELTCLRLADAVVASSQTSKDWVVGRHALDPSVVPVIPAGVDLERYRPRKRSASPAAVRLPTVVFVGRVTTSKGADTLVEAVARLWREYPDLRVVLVGRIDDRFRDDLMAIARGARPAGAAGGLEFIGHVEHDRLPKIIAEADIFALPSRYEAGPGLAFLEAMACGVAVIGPSGGAIADVIVDGVNGLLVPPGDVDALATQLRLLLEDDELRDRLARGARAEVEAEWDTTDWVPRSVDLYRGLLAARSQDVA